MTIYSLILMRLMPVTGCTCSVYRYRQDARAQADYTFSSDELLSKDNIIATPAKIGFLGLGIMGSGMVTNLLRSGHEVTVWNRTPSKVSSQPLMRSPYGTARHLRYHPPPLIRSASGIVRPPTYPYPHKVTSWDRTP